MGFSSGWFQTQSGRQGLMGLIIQQQAIRMCDPSGSGACAHCQARAIVVFSGLLSNFL
jgi:hypothetical protein